ncbi:MAG: uL13 family ribosomal protein [Patescibacteria group bacterium]
MEKHTINAAGKKMGRLASEIAKLLLGKNRTDFVKNKILPVQIVVTNASAIDHPPKKGTQHVYKRFSGYASGQKQETRAATIERRGIEAALRMTVERMLPRNTLRTNRMKQLIIKETV